MRIGSRSETDHSRPALGGCVTRKSIPIVVLMLGLLMGISCQPTFAEGSSIGIVALQRGQSYYYLGLLGRSGLSITETVSILTELGVAKGVTRYITDEDVEFIDGSLVFHFPTGRLRAYLGLGTGFCRWAYSYSGVRTTFYSLLLGGVDFISAIGAPRFYIEGKTITERFNPIVSIGWYFPFP